MPYLVDQMADRPHDTKAFAAGLLNPNIEKPDSVTGPNGAAADKRYNVYRNNVTVSLINAMADIFPAVQKITGEEYFRAMAREYVRAYPPSSPLLFLYGQDFAEFIESFDPAKTMPYLADVARAERGWLTAYHAADQKPLEAAILGAVDPARMAEVCFEPHPATFLLQSRYPVHDIFLMNRDFMEVSALDMSIGQNLMLTRPELDIRIIQTSAADHAFLEAIISGRNLGEAAAAGMGKDAAFDLNNALSMLLGTGATQSITLDGQKI